MKGKEYPDTFAELEKMFKSDSDCYDYLKKLIEAAINGIDFSAEI